MEYAEIVDNYGNDSYNGNVDYKPVKSNVSGSKYKAYQKLIESGELTPLADFDLYDNISNEIDEKIVGIRTANGIEIKSKSNHFIARVIGSVEQKRNGVPIDDVKSILTNPDKIDDAIGSGDKISQRFIKNGVGSLTVNPKTGNLIQVNPLKVVKKHD